MGQNFTVKGFIEMSEELMSLEELDALEEKHRIYMDKEEHRLMTTARAAHRLQEEVERLKVDLLCAKELNKKYEQLVKDCNWLSERLKAENEELIHDIDRHLTICSELTTENEELKRYAEAQTKAMAKVLGCAPSDEVVLIEVARVKEEKEGLRKDAERYRWLKRDSSIGSDEGELIIMYTKENHWDAHIDAAMKNGGDGE